MPCNCNSTGPISVVQGSNTSINVFLTDQISGCPLDLSNLTGATAYFSAASGGAISASGILVSPVLGQIRVDLTPDFTTAMTPGENLDVQVNIDQGTIRTIAQILGQLTVAPSLFAS